MSFLRNALPSLGLRQSPTFVISASPKGFASAPSRGISVSRALTELKAKSNVSALRGRVAQLSKKGALAAGVGLSFSLFGVKTAHCDPLPPKTAQSNQPKYDENELPPPPISSVSFYELGFGTVAGICAGIFVKKGAKAAAFLLGGVFVLLQYLGAQSLVRVDWARMGRRFEDLFHTVDAQGVKRAPNVLSVWRWFINFLTADFQPRASFIAGFALGLRVG